MTPKNLLKADANIMFETDERYRNYTLNDMYLSRKNDPVKSAVIVASSNDILKKMLEDIRNSIWWNHEAHFLIINDDVENGCDLAHLFLKTVWSFNILSAIYLCNNFNNEPKLFTFNPYTNLAPTFWNRDVNFLDKYWTLFQHQFKSSSQSFESLFSHSEYINHNHVFLSL